MRNWASSGVFTELARRFRAAWRAIPARHRRAWLVTVLGGAVGVTALLLIMVMAGRHFAGNGAFSWERPLLQRLEAGDRGFGFSDALWFQTFGSDIMFVALFIVIGGISIWMRRPMTALSLLLTYLLLHLEVRLGWMLWHRPRPDFIASGIAAPSFHSFPSGHTAKTAAFYGLLALLWMRASRSTWERLLAVVLWLAIALVVPLSRLRIGAHWPTDIMGGYAIGLAWLVVLWLGLKHERVAAE